MAFIPNLLNYGEPIGIGASLFNQRPLVSPFASQYTATGLLPRTTVQPQLRLLPGEPVAAPVQAQPQPQPVYSEAPNDNGANSYDVADTINSSVADALDQAQLSDLTGGFMNSGFSNASAMGVLGGLTGVTGLGAIGSAIGASMDAKDANSVLSGTIGEAPLGSKDVVSATINSITGGLFGSPIEDAYQSALGNYIDAVEQDWAKPGNLIGNWALAHQEDDMLENLGLSAPSFDPNAYGYGFVTPGDPVDTLNFNSLADLAAHVGAYGLGYGPQGGPGFDSGDMGPDSVGDLSNAEDDSMESGLEGDDSTDAGEGFSGGDPDGADADDGGDTGDGTHICTAAFAAGISSRKRFRANRRYGIHLRRTDPKLMRGYDKVGPWIAKKIGHTKAADVLTKMYEYRASNAPMPLRYKILFKTLCCTVRPVVRVIGAVC